MAACKWITHCFHIKDSSLLQISLLFTPQHATNRPLSEGFMTTEVTGVSLSISCGVIYMTARYLSLFLSSLPLYTIFTTPPHHWLTFCKIKFLQKCSVEHVQGSVNNTQHYIKSIQIVN